MTPAAAAKAAAEAAERAHAVVFLGGPPDLAASHYIGRIRLYRHDRADAWTRGVLVLPAGTPIPWIAYSDGVNRHQSLFQPSVRVVVTGHHLSGELYLTGIRAATDTEWPDTADGR